MWFSGDNRLQLLYSISGHHIIKKKKKRRYYNTLKCVEKATKLISEVKEWAQEITCNINLFRGRLGAGEGREKGVGKRFNYIM